MMKGLGYLLGLMFIGLFACEEQFDFETDIGNQGNVIVTGSINQSDGPYLIRVQEIRETTSIGRVDIGNACVEVMDTHGNIEQCPQRRGTYRCEGNLVRGQVGEAYAVRVQLGERIFESSFDTIPDNAFPEFDLSWEQGKLAVTSDLGIDSEINAVFVSLKSEIPKTERPLYLTWVGEEIYQFLQKLQLYAFQPPPPCYVIGNYGGDQIRLLDNTQFSGAYDLPSTLFREIDDTFLRKHIFMIHQMSISRDYYEYLLNIETLIEQTGSLFDKPPGQAIGNIRSVNSTDRAHGFFSAVVVDTAAVAIYPSQIENVLIVDRCATRFTADRCFGCPNTGRYSDYDRPPYYDRIN